ncbi:helix-turn-helix transcriptional regulator [Fulvimarina sp. 2208YS6-2-32]|uniref:Helix-turn-helix transcriptional regulator n=1 Tax=Fulvimarina uroteuthidis TaxID=3098149 RepID=A0ABU5I3F9_9HYPH|nr:helix-turn-helix transcriptional regulator [Fulvimarina sp. 2208YS6-2-32]MDY8109888.1 helix-turn-helix transcriptional regulator [Fulvimarina sp. 2208YS6-2-32]
MKTNRDRGQRIRQAMKEKRFSKVQALAVELDVSVAAVSRWQNGGHISLDHICLLAERLDVSLDWLLLERGTLDWHRGSPFQQSELQHIAFLRRQSPRVRAIFLDLVKALGDGADSRAT